VVWHGVSPDVVWYILCCGIGRVVQYGLYTVLFIRIYIILFFKRYLKATPTVIVLLLII
jgi:hypothetical protein